MWVVVLLGAPAALAAPGAEPSPTATPEPPPAPVVQMLSVPYTAWNGTVLTATVLLPLDYDLQSGEVLPCVVQPHGRGSTPAHAAALWNGLPTERRFAVICPHAVGLLGDGNSWAVPGQIDDIVAMPDVMEAAVPGLRLDRDRLYLAGSSMGGQEALMALARAPDRFAAAAAFDGAADLAARYYDMGRAGQFRDQQRLRRELGGPPDRKRFAYAQRSPLSVAATIARSGVPLRVGWSMADAVVTRSGATQFGRLCRRLRELSPALQLEEAITALPHGGAIHDTASIVEFFAPAGVWRTRHASSPVSWTYRGWQSGAQVWGRRIEVPGSAGSAWWSVSGEGDTLTVQSPGYLRVALPWPDGDGAVRVEVDGRVRTVRPRDGTLLLAFVAGRHTAVIERR